MKKTTFLVIVLFFILACGKDKGKISIWIKDAPPPQDVQHIYLTVHAVAVRNTAGDPFILEDYPYSFDILRFAGGLYTSLTYDIKSGSEFVDLEPGDYTSVVIVFSSIHSTVRAGITGNMIIPEGTPTTYALEQDFSLSSGEYVTIVVDLDASKSVNWESDPYEFTPSLTIFESSVAGYIGGMVRDTSGTAIRLALCTAANSTDTLTTWTNNSGRYLLMLPTDTYNISASAEGYLISDTIYNGITAIRDSVLDSHNFILE